MTSQGILMTPQGLILNAVIVLLSYSQLVQDSNNGPHVDASVLYLSYAVIVLFSYSQLVQDSNDGQPCRWPLKESLNSQVF